MDVPNFEDSSAHHVDLFTRYVEKMVFLVTLPLSGSNHSGLRFLTALLPLVL